MKLFTCGKSSIFSRQRQKGHRWELGIGYSHKRMVMLYSWCHNIRVGSGLTEVLVGEVIDQT